MQGMESFLLHEAVFHTIYRSYYVFKSTLRNLQKPRNTATPQGWLQMNRSADAPLLDGALGSLTWWCQLAHSRAWNEMRVSSNPIHSLMILR